MLQIRAFISRTHYSSSSPSSFVLRSSGCYQRICSLVVRRGEASDDCELMMPAGGSITHLVNGSICCYYSCCWIKNIALALQFAFSITDRRAGGRVYRERVCVCVWFVMWCWLTEWLYAPLKETNDMLHSCSEYKFLVNPTYSLTHTWDELDGGSCVAYPFLFVNGPA